VLRLEQLGRRRQHALVHHALDHPPLQRVRRSVARDLAADPLLVVGLLGRFNRSLARGRLRRSRRVVRLRLGVVLLLGAGGGRGRGRHD
jgi:hypothetical protein